MTRLTKLIPRLPMEVTHPVYHSFMAEHPAVIQPLMTLQAMLRAKCFGVKYWKKMQGRRFKHKDQMCADFLVKLNAINLDLYRQRMVDAEVDLRMTEWRKEKEEQAAQHPVQEDNTLSDHYCGTAAATALAMPPPSLRVLQHLGGAGGGNKQTRTKKKRKRHSRKPPQQGPFGGPKEWLGRDGPLPVLQVPPEVLAALEEKNARKAKQRERRIAIRGRNARIAAENKQKELEKSREMEETVQERKLREMKELRDKQLGKPKIKYLPKVEPGMKPAIVAPGKILGFHRQESYVENLWD